MNEKTKIATRDTTFDLAKFIVMLFVVYGHMPWFFAGNVNGVSYFSNFNIGLAMPFFFIASGYFSHSSLESRGGVRLLQG